MKYSFKGNLVFQTNVFEGEIPNLTLDIFHLDVHLMTPVIAKLRYITEIQFFGEINC